MQRGVWVVASIAVHAAFVGGLSAAAWTEAAEKRAPDPVRPDVWIGGLVEVDTPEAAAEPKTQAPAAPIQPSAQSRQVQPARQAPRPPPAPQLAAPVAGAQGPRRAEAAGGDPLVERLLAAERQKMARRLREQAQAAAAQSSPSAQPASVGESSGPSAGAISKLPAGKRDLGTAFARALPYAASADRAWQQLPTGFSAKLDLTLDLEDGALAPLPQALSEVPKDSAPLVKLENTVRRMLAGGQFALAQRSKADHAASGAQRLRLRVRLTEVTPPPSLELGFTAPTWSTPGSAYFVLESGRRFDATIELLP